MRMMTLPHFAQPVNIDLITRVRAYAPYWSFKDDRCIKRKYGFWGKPYRVRGWSYLHPAQIRVYFPGDNDFVTITCKPGEVERWYQEIEEFLVSHNWKCPND